MRPDEPFVDKQNVPKPEKPIPHSVSRLLREVAELEGTIGEICIRLMTLTKPTAEGDEVSGVVNDLGVSSDLTILLDDQVMRLSRVNTRLGVLLENLEI